jgi:endonuclease/exonuclease/phosphatase family metal-dependent hydrolase
LRLASYNIRKSVGLDWRRDPYRIIEVVNGLDADVVALQEVDKRLGARQASLSRRAVEDETDFQIADLAGSEVSLGWHGNAVLVRKGLTIHNVDRIELPGLEPRGAVRVEVGDGDARLSVLGVHLGLMRRFRRAQLARIVADLAKRGITDAALLGDFNEWSATEGLEPLAPDFTTMSPGKSFHSAWPMAGLDRIALSRRLTLLDAGVSETAQAKVASDHLPIWGDVRFDRDSDQNR